MQGRAYFDAAVYGAAMVEFNDILEYDPPVYHSDNSLLTTHAEFAKAQAAVRMELPEAEIMVLNFIEKHEPDPVATEAVLEIANYYFASRKYDQAIEYYDRVHSEGLSSELKSSVLFKKGYANFLNKNFALAEKSFASVRSQSEYYYPANYYLGMCKFIEGDFNGAVVSFEKANKSDAYRKYVPYYTTLLHFAMRDFDEVIAYGTPKLSQTSLFKETEMRHLIGQAYFETGDYARAIPFLEQYAESIEKLKPGELYQLAFAQYQIGDCEKASKTFVELSSLKNPMGQRANFYIADCNLVSGDLRMARNAFRSVSKMDFDLELQEEALFNYGKLSAELNYDKEAIQTLDAFTPSSKYYAESQKVLDDVFTYTQDFATALATLEEFDALSLTLKAAYQRLSFMHGIQLMNDANLTEADAAFKKSETYPVDARYSAQSVFWRAEIAHTDNRYESSRDLFNTYFKLEKLTKDLPVETSLAVASYAQGYNYLRQNKYNTALGHFETAVNGIHGNPSAYSDTYYSKQMLPDAYVRAGDCLFKLNRYHAAMAHYDDAIDNSESVYAQFQKAMILGLTDRTLDKVVMLEEIVSNNSESQFADNALFELAITYHQMQSSEKALPALKRIVNNYPSSELRNAAYLRMGLISFNNGDLSSAIKNYKTVFNNNPASNEAQEALAALEEIYIQELASPDEYFAFMESIPGYEVSAFRRDSVRFRTAEIQYENGEYSKAVNSFAIYLEKFPNGTNRLSAHYYSAESYGILKEYDNALEEYDAVVQKSTSAYYLKALTKAASLSYHHQQDFSKSFDYYAQLADILTDPRGKFDAQLGMMRSAYRNEQWTDARIAGISVLNFTDASDEEKSEAHYCVAKSSYDTEQLDDAIAHFNEVSKLSNNALTAEARYLIATVYFRRNQLDLSEQLTHNANADNSNYPYWVGKGLILLSDIYVARGDYFNAKAPLEALVENFQGESVIIEEAREKLISVQDMEHLNSRLKADSDTIELDIIDHDGNE